MKWVLVTQRVDRIPDRNETRDAVDQALCRLVQRAGGTPVPVPNVTADAARFAAELGAHAVLFSGGNTLGVAAQAEDVSRLRDETEGQLLRWCVDHRIPAVGLCRGMQLLCAHFGAKVEPVKGHVRARTKVTRCGAAFPWYPERMEVGCFHGFGVRSLDAASELEAAFRDEAGHVEAVRHRSLPISGIMWHPEREPEVPAADLRFFQEGLGL